ncbi:MAG TPA: class I SAM-dependent methyltransferase [Bryobacteraceae bacterium]|nr:class I SAM-dependent methyltransferase [Bryobacteraceae bacterium]
MTPTTQLTPMRVFDTLRAYQETAALKSAIELGVFTVIGKGTSSAAEISAKCNASERGVRILCDSLVVGGFLSKKDGRYENSEESRFFLDRESPAYLGSITEFLCAPEMVQGLIGGLTGAVRAGGTVMGGEGTVADNNEIWVQFARAMAPIMMPAAQFIAGQIPASGALKVLDIAAGHGMFGITVAKKNPQARITALDWAAVLEVAKEHAAKFGVADRYETLPGSAFDVDFGSGYDVVLITNFMHHFEMPKNEAFLAKCCAALKPGGRAVTLEFVPDADRVSPPVPARFALTMLFGTRGGDAYTYAEYEPAFRSAGFSSCEIHRLETQQSVIIATK